MSSPTSPHAPFPDQPQPVEAEIVAPTDAARPRLPRGWLITLAVLAVALLISAIVLISVVKPPSYEPVPIPSVSST